MKAPNRTCCRPSLPRAWQLATLSHDVVRNDGPHHDPGNDREHWHDDELKNCNQLLARFFAKAEPDDGRQKVEPRDINGFDQLVFERDPVLLGSWS